MSAPFVVVGAGVAGCVAARTLADEGVPVVVVEAGPGPSRPAELDRLDHLGGTAATDWWFPDEPRRGRGVGGSSAVNGMVLDALHPLDLKRWGWDDGLEDQRWVLDRWRSIEVEAGPFTDAFGRLATLGFPRRSSTAQPIVDADQAHGWRPLSLVSTEDGRISAADAFLGDDIELITDAPVVAVAPADRRVTLADGTRIDADHIVLAAGTTGSPRLLVESGLVSIEQVAPPLNHPSTAVIVELAPELRVPLGIDRPPSARLLRAVSGLSESTVDFQMLVLDHTGDDADGRAHGAVIVSALEPDRQKVLVAAITQVLHWLGELEGAGKVLLSSDQTPVQHHCCTLTEAPLPSGPITVVDASVLPALPHTNPMVAVAVNARRRIRAVVNDA